MRCGRWAGAAATEIVVQFQWRVGDHGSATRPLVIYLAGVLFPKARWAGGRRSPLSISLDHLVGSYKQAGWDGQAKHLRRFEIDHRFKFGRRLHRQIGGLVAAQDAVDIGRRLAKHISEVDSVGHEPASRDERTDR